MAAYAALLSLKYIVEQLQHHPRPPISIEQNHVQSLIEKVNFLQHFLEDYSRNRDKEVVRLQSHIAEAAYAAEDVMESYIVDQILAQSTLTHGEQISSVDFYQGLQKVIQDMDLIKKEAMEIKEKIKPVQDIQQHKTRSIPAAASSRSSSTEKNTMVGFNDLLEEVMDKLTRRQSNRQIITIVGMGGIGKTTLAKNVYENPLIVQRFDIRYWAIISQEYSVKEILLELLHDRSQESSSQTSEAELGKRLYQRLYGRRFLIVMDDLWSIEAWDKLKQYFPENNCGSGIIITSRISNLASLIPGACRVEMSFLNQDRSWNLLCNIVFGEDSCPLELEEIGKEIAEKCKGLPLSIVVIGGLLAKSERTREYWKYIAKNLNSYVNLWDNEQCLKLLYLSYNDLPIHLKPCFLYMGIFSEDDRIDASELIKLWVSEGFLKPICGKSLEEVAEEYLKALVDRNLILVDKWKRNGKIKLCKMHDLLRDMCLQEAKKDKFLFATRQRSLTNFSQDIFTQRRIAIHRCASWKQKGGYYLLEIRNARQSAPLARSFIQVSLEILPFSNSRLSRILKVVNEESGHYRLEYLFRLVNLRSIAIASNWIQFNFFTIPSSIYLLWNLQTLVVDQALVTNVDIWKMPLLRHVKLRQLYFNDPGQDDFILENLRTLSQIGNFKFGEEVVKRIPNIQKLDFFYGANALTAPHYCLDNLGRLHKLESLSCSVLQEPGRSVNWMTNLTFPHTLKKLTLNGCNFQWGDMSTMIGLLPHLQVLKLGWNSFTGREWETIEGQFPSLKFLRIQCQELECWATKASHFPRLEHLLLDNLQNLKKIPSNLGNIPTLKLIRIDNCSNAVVVSAKKIAEKQDELENQDLQVRVLLAYYMPDEELERMASHNFLVGGE